MPFLISLIICQMALQRRQGLGGEGFQSVVVAFFGIFTEQANGFQMRALYCMVV